MWSQVYNSHKEMEEIGDSSLNKELEVLKVLSENNFSSSESTSIEMDK